ncbi:hypothetical protein [Streptomyces sp. NPDC058579]|uniref:hypothetical protein n=1 Tax=Streptomyces sp. NPDC058579 TaxID=3346548 RepID=UPI003668F8AB
MCGLSHRLVGQLRRTPEIVTYWPDQTERAAAVALVGRHRPDLVAPATLRIGITSPHSFQYPYADQAARANDPGHMPGAIRFHDGVSGIPTAFR